MIKIARLPAGKYVVAVSGGVDSMVLLDLLMQQSQLELIVAHFDHGIRPDSKLDELLVRSTAMSHNISYVSERAELGPNASEALARAERYALLSSVCKKYNALAILTAHHEDDLLETAAINIVRGTGRRGLTSLASHPPLMRPLLSIRKDTIIAYARARQLPWREDSTNQNEQYLRNAIRHRLAAELMPEIRKQLLSLIKRQRQLNKTIDRELTAWIARNAVQQNTTISLPRYQLIMMPQEVSYELLQQLMKQYIGTTLPRPLIEKLLHFVKTARWHARFQLNERWQVRIDKGVVIVEQRSS